MPTFNARSTTIRLSTAPLATTTTTNPINRQCNEGTADIKRIFNEFTQASKDSTLSESAILDEDNGSHLRFLGSSSDIPFFIVRAGQELLSSRTDGGKDWNARRSAKGVARAGSIELNADREVGGKRKRDDLEKSHQSGKKADPLPKGNSTKASAKFSPDKKRNKESTPSRPCLPIDTDLNINTVTYEPDVLCLTISLSHRSFIPNLLLNPNPCRKDISDIQILVYLNGKFAASAFVAERFSQPHLTNVVRVAGIRCGRLTEKPWVLLSSGDQLLSRDTEATRRNVRWASISHLLHQEAETLETNRWGDRCACGEWLESLSKVKCPREVQGMSQSFACLDIVILYGRGGKDGPGCAHRFGPERMRDETFHTAPQKSQTESPGGEHMHPVVGGLKLASVTGDVEGPSHETSKPVQDSPDPLATTPRKSSRLETYLAVNTTSKPPLEAQSPTLTRPSMLTLTPTPQRAPTNAKPTSPANHPQNSFAAFSSPETPLSKAKARNPVADRELTALTTMYPLTTDPIKSSSLYKRQDTDDQRLTRSTTANSAISSRDSSPLSSAPSEEGVEDMSPPEIRVVPSTPTSTNTNTSTKERKILTLTYRYPPAKPDTTTSTAKATNPVHPTLLIHGFETSPTQPRKKRRTMSGVSGADQSIVDQMDRIIEPACGKVGAAVATGGVIVQAEESVIGLAREGLVRNVGAERGGWFREEGVVVGVRFLVG